MTHEASYTLLYRRVGYAEAADGRKVPVEVSAHGFECRWDNTRVGIVRWKVSLSDFGQEPDTGEYAVIERGLGHFVVTIESAIGLFRELMDSYNGYGRYRMSIEEAQDESE